MSKLGRTCAVGLFEAKDGVSQYAEAVWEGMVETRLSTRKGVVCLNSVKHCGSENMAVFGMVR